MQYFITGASGFIGRRLVKKLLAREGSAIYFLVRAAELNSLDALYEFWDFTPAEKARVLPVVGDLTEPGLGIAAVDRKKLGKKTTHFFHLAAIYDLTADAESQLKVNVQGTRNAVQFAESIGAKHFHLFSSIASAGMFEGLFREDMFEEAEGLDHPYFKTKHAAITPMSERSRSSAADPVAALSDCCGDSPARTIQASSLWLMPWAKTPLSVPIAIFTPAACARAIACTCRSETARTLASISGVTRSSPLACARPVARSVTPGVRSPTRFNPKAPTPAVAEGA